MRLPLTTPLFIYTRLSPPPPPPSLFLGAPSPQHPTVYLFSFIPPPSLPRCTFPSPSHCLSIVVHSSTLPKCTFPSLSHCLSNVVHSSTLPRCTLPSPSRCLSILVHSSPPSRCAISLISYGISFGAAGLAGNLYLNILLTNCVELPGLLPVL